MNHDQVVTVCRIVRQLCPAQKLEDLTPDAWAMVLDDIRYEDAQEAIKALGRRQNFISPADIRAEVRRIRTIRINAAPAPIPPADLDARQSVAWVKNYWRAIGDGETPPDNHRPLGTHRMPRELLAGRRIDEDTESIPDQEKKAS